MFVVFRRPAQPHPLLAAARNAFQGDVQVHLDIGAALRARVAAEESLERTEAAEVEIEPAENVLEIDAAEQVLAAEAGDAGETARIVFRALLRIGEDRVGLGDFLEAFFGPGFLVAVGVVFQREIAKRVLDRLLVGVLGDAQNFVVVALGSCGNGGPPGLCSVNGVPRTPHRPLCRAAPSR